MELLVVSTWWDLSEKNGASSYSTHILKLVKENFEKIIFLHPYLPNGQFYHKEIPIYEHFYYKGFFKNKNLALYTDYNCDFKKKLKIIKNQYNIDVTLVGFPWGIKTINKIIGKTIIYNAHGFEIDFAKIIYKNSKFKYLYYYLIKKHEDNAIKYSKVVISIGKLLKNKLIQHYPSHRNKFNSIEMGLNSFNEQKKMENKQEIRIKYGLSSRKYYYVFHGGLSHPPNLLAVNKIINEIAPEVKKISNKIEFCIIGKGNRKGKQANVHFFPFIENLDDILSIMDVAIMPITEGSGSRIKVLDYIKNNLPIITTKTGIEGYNFSNNEMLIVEDNNIQEFIKGIIYMSENPPFMNELVKNCKKKTENLYSFLAMKKRMEKIIQNYVK